MKPLHEAIEEYIQIRQALGLKFKHAARGLRHFGSFLESNVATHVTVALAVEWATQSLKASRAVAAKRLTWVRGFARHWSATDPRTQVPPETLLPYKPKRARPYFYSDEDILRIMDAARQMIPLGGLRGKTYSRVFGLLAVTGLRISEVVRLERADVDFEESMLIVRKSKFGKTRLVPLDSSVVGELAGYATARDAHVPRARTAMFFVNEDGRSLRTGTVEDRFRELCRKIGLRPPTGRGPRLHDFRHRYAIGTLTRWYRNNEDIERLLPVLSTYLGHSSVADTYWYISVEPELMGAAVQRLERRWEVRHAD
jgi:integrase/recombinase XerD